MIFEKLINDFKQVVPTVDFWSLRIVLNEDETLHVREDNVQPPKITQSFGAHITLFNNNGFAYAATSQLNRRGFKQAINKALAWAEMNGGKTIVAGLDFPKPMVSGSYQTQIDTAWESTSLNEKLDLLVKVNHALKIDDSIVDWQAHLSRQKTNSVLVTSDGVEIDQYFHYIVPGMEAVANKGNQTQRRSGGGWGTARQGGLEQLEAFNFPNAAQQIAEEAIALVDAPQCPSGTMSVLLLPNQMMLQIHESIGHPLELDRILGDERNYAGTSFVTLDMCGSYQYGSDLLNITFDPTHGEQLASYGFDDEGSKADKTFIIRNGLLERFLGSTTSQSRTQLPGVANARASDWNRPAIDRMANLNLEPGSSPMEELVASIENGVLMDTNLSWSIDDSRNKFQFGCELGKIIKDGEIKGLVKNPNYRGISSTFWRNLSGVGNNSTFEIWGTPYCGKGEPNQMVQVGHASPACVFHQVEVFGGD